MNRTIRDDGTHFLTVSAPRHSWCCIWLYTQILESLLSLCTPGQSLGEVGVLDRFSVSESNIRSLLLRQFDKYFV